MPDLLGFTITRTGSTSLTVPTWTISGQVVDSTHQGTVLRDFTGANAILFPQVLGNFSAAQLDDWLQKQVMDILSKRFGLF